MSRSSIPAVTIAKLIEAHLEHDEEKFLSYAEFIAETYHKDGDYLREKIIRHRLDGSYKTEPTVTLDEEEEMKTTSYYRVMVFGDNVKYGDKINRINVSKEYEILEHSGPIQNKEALIQYLRNLLKEHPKWYYKIYRIEKVNISNKTKKDGSPILRSNVISIGFLLPDDIERLRDYKKII